MGKNKRIQFDVLDTRTNQTVQVDSQEEVETFIWLLHAKEIGIIKDFTYQPCSFLLSPSVKFRNSKGKERTLFQEHVYSPDFLIEVVDQRLKDEFKVLTEDNKIYIDVKGTFARNGGERSFTLNQKWTYQKYGIYIYKLVPKKFFTKFGICHELTLTQKTKKPSKKYAGYPSVDILFKDVISQ